jgi:hypothetical protein
METSTKKQWYRTSKFDYKINPVEVVKSTETSVWILDEYFKKGNIDRKARFSEYNNYWETFELAKEHLITRAERKIRFFEGEIKKAKDAINEFKNT